VDKINGLEQAPRPRRADARRNQAALLDAAAAVFVRSGVEAPVRDIAAEAGVGTATIYRHFPTRADLIIAVYRHQVEACAEAGPALLAAGPTPYAALGRWIDMFVDFLVTKHGLAAVLRGDSAGFASLHSWFLDRLVPVCARLLDAAADAGEIRSDIKASELMRGVGNLCVGAGDDAGYDARRLAGLLIAGLREPRLSRQDEPRLPGRQTTGTDFAGAPILMRGRETEIWSDRGTGRLRGRVPRALRPGVPVHRPARWHRPGRGPGGRGLRHRVPAAGLLRPRSRVGAVLALRYRGQRPARPLAGRAGTARA
jgi:AcrR family transcriptional regulator